MVLVFIADFMLKNWLLRFASRKFDKLIPTYFLLIPGNHDQSPARGTLGFDDKKHDMFYRRFFGYIPRLNHPSR